MEDYILISWLNDYIFCPYSIYLHNVYSAVDTKLYYTTAQTKGAAAHASIDGAKYSTHKDDLCGIEVYSNHYGLCGKIDLFQQNKKLLVERKRKIATIYDGYRYQLYAQYFALLEMGYEVKEICFHSLIDNKRYPVELPSGAELDKFEQVVNEVKQFNPDQIKDTLVTNIQKCRYCIYRQLCDVTDYDEDSEKC
jgi:CRISPR-associated protein Cas4